MTEYILEYIILYNLYILNILSNKTILLKISIIFLNFICHYNKRYNFKYIKRIHIEWS